MVYAMQFSETKFSVPTRNGQYQPVTVEYKLPSAQISLMLSYKIVENHLSIEVGPVSSLTTNLRLMTTKKAMLSGRGAQRQWKNLLAGDILKINQFNLYPAAGITAGVRHFRLNVQYMWPVQYVR
jgi:hypothetical protein